jgi:hypothetical protein
MPRRPGVNVGGSGRIVGTYAERLAERSGLPAFDDIDPSRSPQVESEPAFLRRCMAC